MMTRRHNDANILCIGSRTTTAELAIAYVKEFLYHKFDGGRHEDRVEKIELDYIDPAKVDRAFDRTCN